MLTFRDEKPSRISDGLSQRGFLHLGDRLSRRQLLQIGGVATLGLGLPEFLHARAPVSSKESRKGGEKSCIFIVQYGGASHMDSWDLKPGAPTEIRGPYKPIPTNVPGVQVGELLPRLAKMADKYCLIRSMSHGNIEHNTGMHMCMTGHTVPAPDSPYYGAVLAKLRPATRNVPPYVWLQNIAGDVEPRYLTGGFLGPVYSPLHIGTDLNNVSAPNFRVTAFDPVTGVSAGRLLERHQLMNQMETVGRIGNPSWRALPAANLQRFQERAVDMVTGPEARRAFDLDKEPTGVRDRYGRHPLGQNLLLARRLIEAGVRLVSVTAWTGTPPGEKFKNTETWDMHGEEAELGSIFGKGAFGLGWALPCVDEAVSALLGDLSIRGLLENTLVVMVGEFGRTPKIHKAGRNHWPAAYSAMLAGAGIRGGLVYGSSDKNGAYVKDNPVSPEAFGATLFHALGVAPETRLGADGFTKPASTGRPIMELFA